jgi:uncharacterized oxidoreductase
MKLQNDTVLITGGSSGIGFELGKVLVKKGNKVIICGKSGEKLEAAKQQEPKFITYQCDLSDSKECSDFAHKIREIHPDLNVLVNNAAIVHKTSFLNDPQIMEKLVAELQTNLIAPVQLIHELIPVLEKNRNAEIINITTGLIYIPRALYPFYNATKAALHSFTQVLRHQMTGKSINIVEVMFPAVDTPWHQGNPPKIAISAQKAVAEMITGLEKNKAEIRVGGAKLLYKMSRLAPEFALKKVNSLK